MTNISAYSDSDDDIPDLVDVSILKDNEEVIEQIKVPVTIITGYLGMFIIV